MNKATTRKTGPQLRSSSTSSIHVPAPRAFPGVRPGQPCGDDERLPQGPCPSAQPSTAIERQGGAEDESTLFVEGRPCDGQVACRVADTELPEVDDAAQLPIVHEKIAHADVAAYPRQPDRRFAGECRPPRGEGVCSPATKPRREDIDGLSSLLVVDRQTRAPMERIGTGRRSVIRCRDRLEGAKKGRQIGREALQVCDPLRSGGHAPQPATNRPVPRVAKERAPHRDGHGDRLRKPRGQERKPALLASDLRNIAAALGRRTDRSSPRRNIRLSHPPGPTAETGNRAHSGNWARTSCSTRPTVIPAGSTGNGVMRNGMPSAVDRERP